MSKQHEKERELAHMLTNLKSLTEQLAKEILSFLSDYRKYFGATFIYEGEDYIEVSRRETRDIEYVISVIAGDQQAPSFGY